MINVNIFNHFHCEFWINFKLRIVKIMAIIHFFIGANFRFVNEFNGSRKATYNNWLEDNANKNP